MKYIVKNCPALLNNETIYMECQDETTEHLQCRENENCIIKQIAELCKENKFFGYGPLMLENGLSADILDLLEIEEANE